MSKKSDEPRGDDGRRTKVMSFSAASDVIAELESYAATKSVSLSRAIDSLLRVGLAKQRQAAADVALSNQLTRILQRMRQAAVSVEWGALQVPRRRGIGTYTVDLEAEIVLLAAMVGTYGQHPIARALTPDVLSDRSPGHRALWRALGLPVHYARRANPDPGPATIAALAADQIEHPTAPTQQAVPELEHYVERLKTLWPSVKPVLPRSACSLVFAAAARRDDMNAPAQAKKTIGLNLPFAELDAVEARARIPIEFDEFGD